MIKTNPIKTFSQNIKPPKVFIIILQYNNSQDTIKCMENVKELNYSNYETIILDNASLLEHQNSTRLWIESQKKASEKHTFITNKKNLGYAGGNNVGIRKALKNGADYVLILNPDVTVSKNLLTNLVSKAKSDFNVGLISPSINEGEDIINCGKVKWLSPQLEHIFSQDLAVSTYSPHFFIFRFSFCALHFFKSRHFDIFKFFSLSPSLYLPGACLLIKSEVFQKIGLLDEQYFLYFEDADFCLRAQRSGFKIATENNTEVSHKVSSSTSQLGSSVLLYFHFRNAHIFNKKLGPWWVKLVLPVWSFWVIIKQLVKVGFFPTRRKVSRAILNGTLDFYRGKISW